MRKYLFFFLIVTVVLQSCNYSLRVEKKRYSKGYYFAYSKIDDKKKNIKTKIQVKRKTITELAFNNINKIERAEAIHAIPETNNIFTNELTASKDKTIVNISFHKVRPFEAINKLYKTKKALIKNYKKPVLIKYLKNTDSPYLEARRRAITTLLVGLALFLGSFPIMLYLSLLIGAIIGGVGFILLIVSMILGIIASIKKNISKIKGNDNNTNANVDIVDVVYLNNGSIIRGNLIEQKINDYVKIQTKDGSIFVYEMTEILKITKEK